ncbi:ATP-binding protein, partial [Arthrobacter deserti]|nr:ATP-binding protein [Arthrobacter deserti]
MAHPHLNPPLAGREETLAAVDDGLRDSRHGGVVLLAPAGLGKTALLRTVARLPLDDLQFFEVPARPAAAAPVPFGALAPFLGGLPEGSEDSSVEVIRTVARFVAQKSKGRRPVLVIDDADGLDSASAAAIAQLAVNGTVRLLMSSRPGTAANADVGALVSEGMLAPLRIEPLDFAQGHELCQSVLGAPVLPGSSRMLVAAAGGNPQTLVLLLAECRRLGRLVRRNDIWLLVDELPRQCRALADLATAELMRLSEGERTAVLTLGLAGPARVRTLAPLVGTGLLERLEARGLARTVAVADQPDAWVRLTPALHEEAVRQLAPLSLKRKVHSWLRALRQDGGLAPEQQVLAVRWALECGETPSPRELLAAARIANAAYQPGTAAFAAAACRTSGSRHPAAVQLARAALCRGQFHTAAAAAGSAIESARDPMVLQEAVLAARQVAMHQGGGEAELEALADRWEAALERIARHWKAGPGHREGVRLLRAEARQLGGHFAASGRELEELAQHGSTGQVRALAVMLLAERQSALGLAAAGAALAERALAAARTAGRTGIRPEQLLARCVLVLIRSGQLARAAEVLEDLYRRPAAMLVFGGTAEFLRGLIDFKRGAADRALARLAAAVEGLRQSDPEQLLPRALAYAAAAASGADDRQAAGRFA